MALLDEIKSKLNKSKSILSNAVSTSTKQQIKKTLDPLGTSQKLINSKLFKGVATEAGTAIENIFEKGKKFAKTDVGKTISTEGVGAMIPAARILPKSMREKAASAGVEFGLDTGASYGRTLKSVGKKGGTEFISDIVKLPQTFKQKGVLEGLGSQEFEDVTNLADIIPGLGKSVSVVGAVIPLLKKSDNVVDVLKTVNKVADASRISGLGRVPEKIHPEDVGILDRAMDVLNMGKKASPKELKNATEFIETLSNTYLKTDEAEKAVTIAKGIKNRDVARLKRLGNVLQKKAKDVVADYRYADNVFAGGLVGIQPEFDEEGKFSGIGGFDPKMAALGVLGVGAVKAIGPKGLEAADESVQSIVDAAILKIDEATDPVRKLTDKLVEATKQREIRKADVTSKRAMQAQLLEKVAENFEGVRLLEEQRKILSGKFDELDFEPLKDITDEDITLLFKQVTDNKVLRSHEKFAAIDALEGVFNGKVPDLSRIKFLEEVFSPELTTELVKMTKEEPSKLQKLAEILNIPRALKATIDFSMPFRQGLFMIGHPEAFTKAFKNQFKYALDEKAYTNLFEEIKAKPSYPLMKQYGVEFTDLSTDLGSREEAFMTNLVDKIPYLGELTKATNRAASGFLNSVRADSFDDFAKRINSLGLDEEVARKELSAMAGYVNNATGRGKFNIKAGRVDLDDPGISALMNSVFFSPKLMASRLTLLNPLYYAKLPKEARKVALKDLAVVVGGGLSILGLAKAAGADVGTDSRSSDFGKIKIGNTRVDIWGGFAQYLVYFARMVSNSTVNSKGELKEFGEGFNASTRASTTLRFARSKLAPIPQTIVDLAEGKNFIGEDVTVGNVANNLLNPLTIDTAIELVKDKENDYGADAFFQLISMLGVGVGTYDSDTKANLKVKVKPKIKTKSKTKVKPKVKPKAR